MSTKEIAMEVGLGHRLEQPPMCTEFLFVFLFYVNGFFCSNSSKKPGTR
jgi:hypothetical protein